MNFSINQTKIVVTFVTGIVHEYRQYQPVLCAVLPVRCTQMQVSWYVTLYTAVVGTIWPLRGSMAGQCYTCSKNVYPVAVGCPSQCDAASLYLFAVIYCVVC